MSKSSWANGVWTGVIRLKETSKTDVYWSGLPSSCPGDLPDPGVELTSFVSPALADGFFTTVPPGKSNIYVYSLNSVAVFQL